MTPRLPKDASKLEDAFERLTVPIGNLFVSLFHRIALWREQHPTTPMALAFLELMQPSLAGLVAGEFGFV